ncbi:MAG: hypothetical protein JXR95_00505 [Deltaproteobacteria bacterium]|nr:hypothetical protein [Deltaproteobacteria bacterium]
MSLTKRNIITFILISLSFFSCRLNDDPPRTLGTGGSQTASSGGNVIKNNDTSGNTGEITENNYEGKDINDSEPVPQDQPLNDDEAEISESNEEGDNQYSTTTTVLPPLKLPSTIKALRASPSSAGDIMNMKIYSSTAISFYYPGSWTPLVNGRYVLIKSDSSDATSNQIHIIPWQFRRRLSSGLGIKMLIAHIGKYHQNMAVTAKRKIKGKYDVTGITFTSEMGSSKMEGFGVALSRGKKGVFAIIMGKKGGFRGINSPLLLGYVLQSMSQGHKPAMPSIQQTDLKVSDKKDVKGAHMNLWGFWKNTDKIFK